jgi:hypothetical protein
MVTLRPTRVTELGSRTCNNALYPFGRCSVLISAETPAVLT